MSNFWFRVSEELDFKGISRKTLAEQCDINVTLIAKGIALKSTPSVDTAVKIAEILGVSVEYLVNGTNKNTNKSKEEEKIQLMLYRKYHELIQKCERLPPEQVQFLGQIADRLQK